MKFTIKNTRLQSGQPPVSVIRVREYLDGLPDGELLTYRELQAELSVSITYARGVKGHPSMACYSTLAKMSGTRIVLFGNPRTIKAYIKEFRV